MFFQVKWPFKEINAIDVSQRLVGFQKRQNSLHAPMGLETQCKASCYFLTRRQQESRATFLVKKILLMNVYAHKMHITIEKKLVTLEMVLHGTCQILP